MPNYELIDLLYSLQAEAGRATMDFVTGTSAAMQAIAALKATHQAELSALG